MLRQMYIPFLAKAFIDRIGHCLHDISSAFYQWAGLVGKLTPPTGISPYIVVRFSLEGLLRTRKQEQESL